MKVIATFLCVLVLSSALTIEDISDSLKSAAERVGRMTGMKPKTTSEKIKDAIKDTMSEVNYENLHALLKDLSKEVEEFSKETKESIGEAYEKTKDKLTTDIDLTTIENLLKKIPRDTMKTVREKTADIKEYGSDKIIELMRKLPHTQVLKSLKLILSEKDFNEFSNLLEGIHEPTLSESIIRKFESLSSKFTNMGDKIMKRLRLTGPHVLVPIAENFEDIEFITVVDILRRAGINVVVAGYDVSSDLVLKSVNKVSYMADISLDEVLSKNMKFDAIVVPGGIGAKDLLDCHDFVEMLKTYKKEGKLIGGICAGSGLVLAKAGLLDDVEATTYPDSYTSKYMMNKKFLKEEMVVDKKKNFVTAQGPGQGIKFGLKLVEMLVGQDRAIKIADELVLSGLYGKGKNGKTDF
jgi:4-methyl-5(b-hydroxyethyl)-thiazole monophosphate biosynthesis